MDYENNELFEESFHDFDNDIDERKALIEEAKQVEESDDWNTLSRTLSDLKRRWRRIYSQESALENELEEEFEAILDKFYAKRRAMFQQVEDAKLALIHEAKVAANDQDFNRATATMKDLMTKWKECGSAGKEKDDELWEEFNGLRNTFFERKHQRWEDLQARFENARKVKEACIVEAAKLADSTSFKETSQAFKELLDRWKEAGNAGKEIEDDLWNQFNEHRQKFFAAREEYFAQLHEKQDGFYAEKETLLAKAKEILEAKAFTREDTTAMKQLSQDWKNVGFSGKTRDDEIWQAFRGVMDDYFAGLKENNELRHKQWVQRNEDRRNRKLELISEQKRQIKRIESEMLSLLGERAIEDAKQRIADKEAFIEELEAQVEEINQLLA